MISKLLAWQCEGHREIAATPSRPERPVSLKSSLATSSLCEQREDDDGVALVDVGKHVRQTTEDCFARSLHGIGPSHAGMIRQHFNSSARSCRNPSANAQSSRCSA